MSLKTVSVSQLRAELTRRERGATRLVSQRDKLQRRLDSILAELANLGVEAGTRRRGRPPDRRGPGRPKGSNGRGPGRPKGSKNRKQGKRAKNSMSLLEAITTGVRKGSTVSPAQAAAAAKSAGYKSVSPNFGMMVANTLAKSSAFKRTGRGQYLHKGGGKVGKGKAGPKRRKPRKAKAAATTKPAAATA